MPEQGFEQLSLFGSSRSEDAGAGAGACEAEAGTDTRQADPGAGARQAAAGAGAGAAVPGTPEAGVAPPPVAAPADPGEAHPQLAGGLFAACDDLEELARTAAACRRCALRAGCRGVVFGEGDPHARIMLVGEAPGATEDELGRPFVGRAGQLLDRILEAIGLARRQVYITNVVKCRPPGNRTPTEAEIRTCLPYLYAQIRLIRPGIIVCMGSTAVRALIHPEARISSVRGTWRQRWGIALMPTFHPAAVLRDPAKKRPIWEDFKAIRRRYDELTGRAGAASP